MEISLVNLFFVSLIAFAVPFLLGFAPKLRVPAVVGEIVAGIVLGPALLGWIQPDETVQVISTIGVAFLLFLAGMELDLECLRGRPLNLGLIGFMISVAIALFFTGFLGAAGIVLSPLLVAVSLSATSVGIVVPVLRDTGQLDTPMGRLTLAGGSAAEFGTIVMLGLFFAIPVRNAVEGAFEVLFMSLALVAFALLAVLALWLIGKAFRWEPGRVLATHLDETSAQIRTRFAIAVLLGAAVLATVFRFEAILGTFIAGIFVGRLLKGDPSEKLYRRRLDAIGFGFFVPVFFIASGLNFTLDGLFTRAELGRIAVFFVLLLLARGLPALLYRKELTAKQMAAAGLMQATNISFIVVATTVGLGYKEMLPVTASSLIVAGLLSALLFPATAQALLGSGPDAGGKPVPVTPEITESL